MIINGFCYYGAAAYFNMVADINFPDYANIAAYVNIITYNRRSAEATGFSLFMTDGYTMPQRAIFSDHHFFVHDQALPMK